MYICAFVRVHLYIYIYIYMYISIYSPHHFFGTFQSHAQSRMVCRGGCQLCDDWINAQPPISAAPYLDCAVANSMLVPLVGDAHPIGLFALPHLHG